MDAPTGQLNTSAKSLEFDKVPITRNLPGDVNSGFQLVPGRFRPHRATPHLGEVQEEQLLSGRVESGQSLVSVSIQA